MKYISLFVLLVASNFLFAQNNAVVVENPDDLLMVGNQLYFFEDESKIMEINDVLKPENQAKFKQNKGLLAFPKQHDSYYWFKITLKNKTSQQLWLEVGSSLLWYVDYYSQVNGVYRLHTQTGAYRSNKNKDFPSNLFWFPLTQSQQTETVYVRFLVQNPAPIPIKIGTLAALSQEKDRHDWVVGGFLGVVFIMFGYNLFLSLVIKDSLYRWYLAYLVMLSVFTPFINDYPFIADIFDDSLRIYFYNYLLTWHSPLFLVISFFSIQFLRLRQDYPRLYAYVLFLLSIMCGLIPFLNLTGLVSEYSLGMFYQLFLLIFYLSLLLISFYVVLLDKSRKAFYYSLAWGGFIFSIFVVIFSVQGIIPYNYLTRNAMFFGASWEILLFSLALANRINTMRKEKERSQKALLEQTKENERILAEQNQVLEKRVTEKTQEIREKAQEIQYFNESLQVSNEELHQTQEEIVAQRDILEKQYQNLLHFQNKITDSINSAHTIQRAILPTKQAMNELFGEYFVLNRPKDVVSGDFYWANYYKNKRFLAVADCTGHGISGAFMTMIGTTLLDKIIIERQQHDPALILEELHLQIVEALQQDITKSQEGMDIAICVMEENAQNIKITFSGAKRPVYWVEKEATEVQKIKGTRKNIGGTTNNEKEFVNEIFTVAKGTCLYLCSDGYTDQNNLMRERFSEEKLVTLLVDIAPYNLEEQKNSLEQALDQHMIGTEQRDDILVVGIRC